MLKVSNTGKRTKSIRAETNLYVFAKNKDQKTLENSPMFSCVFNVLFSQISLLLNVDQNILGILNTFFSFFTIQFAILVVPASITLTRRQQIAGNKQGKQHSSKQSSMKLRDICMK